MSTEPSAINLAQMSGGPIGFPKIPEALTPAQVVEAIDDIRDKLSGSGSPLAAAHGFLLDYLYANHDDIAQCSEENFE